MRSRRPRSVEQPLEVLRPCFGAPEELAQEHHGEGLAAVHLQVPGQAGGMIVPQALEARLESSTAFLRSGERPVQRPMSSCSTRICSATSATTSDEASPSSGGNGTRISRKGTLCLVASISRSISLPRHRGVVPRHIVGAGSMSFSTAARAVRW